METDNRTLQQKIDENRKELERLWFVYGNNGPRHTWGNHKFIQGLLERGEDEREWLRKPGRISQWKPLTRLCEEAVDVVLDTHEFRTD